MAKLQLYKFLFKLLTREFLLAILLEKNIPNETSSLLWVRTIQKKKQTKIDSTGFCGTSGNLNV